MKGSIRNLIVTSVLIVTAGGLAGCATATSSIESGNDIAAAATGNPVVFGKFRLKRRKSASQSAATCSCGCMTSWPEKKLCYDLRLGTVLVFTDLGLSGNRIWPA